LFKRLFIVKSGFACKNISLVNILYFTCKYIVLQSLQPPQLFFLTIFPNPVLQEFSVHFVVSRSYTDAMCFTITHSHAFFSFPAPLFSSNSPTIGIVFYMCVCVYTYIYIYDDACVYIWIYLHHMRENVTICLSEQGLVYIAWFFPVPSIYLWMTKFHSSLWLSNIPLWIYVCIYVCVFTYIFITYIYIYITYIYMIYIYISYIYMIYISHIYMIYIYITFS
jgi:hypothetical protein